MSSAITCPQPSLRDGSGACRESSPWDRPDRASPAGITPSDIDLVKALEAASLSPGDFRHANHVRAAWIYLRHFPLPQALERFRSSLQRFALHLDKPDLYHETITAAYFYLIHERMYGHENEAWEAFRRRNPELLRWKGGLIERLYSPQRLQSELARSHFVLPDLPL